MLDKEHLPLRHDLEDNTVVMNAEHPTSVEAQEKREKAKAEKLLDIDFPVTPHVFRHSKAVHMVRAGINLIYIRDFLGHVDCSTTEIYARIDTESKRKAIEKACKDILPEQEYKDWTTDTDLMAFLESLTKG